MTSTFHYKGYDIPVDLINNTGGGPETFESISDLHISIIQELVGLKHDQSVLEIGCGIGRDAIPLTHLLSRSTGGRYLGIDIDEASIDFCQKNISRQFDNFQFLFWDIRNEWYNPKGKYALSDLRIPLESDSVDLVVLQSVFTHLLPDDITWYLKEFHRVLRRDGKVYATFFLLDCDILDSQGKHSYITFDYRHDSGCFLNDYEQPNKAVGYFLSHVEKIAVESNMTVAKVAYGYWSGKKEKTLGGQDSIVFAKA